jgi:hypothetical protein
MRLPVVVSQRSDVCCSVVGDESAASGGTEAHPARDRHTNNLESNETTHVSSITDP